MISYKTLFTLALGIALGAYSTTILQLRQDNPLQNMELAYIDGDE